MTITITYHSFAGDLDTFHRMTLSCVESIRLTRDGFMVKCFGNDEVLHRRVVAIHFDELY